MVFRLVNFCVKFEVEFFSIIKNELIFGRVG